MEFEWDNNKEQINIKNHHGVSFKDAALVFNDTERIERYDEKNSTNEDRWQTIGVVGEMLFVVYTEREDTTRIISARLANLKECIMAIIKWTLEAGTKPTPEQLVRLREAAKLCILRIARN